MYPFVRWAQGLELTCNRLELTFGWLGLTFEMTWSLFLEGKQSDGGGGVYWNFTIPLLMSTVAAGGTSNHLLIWISV